MFYWLLERQARSLASKILGEAEVRAMALTDAVADEAIDLARWGGPINSGQAMSNVITLSHVAIRALKEFHIEDEDKPKWARLRERWVRYGGQLPAELQEKAGKKA